MLPTRFTIIAFLAAAWCCTSDAEMLYDVACPGVNSELKCPAGHVIQIESLGYGEATDAVCADRTQPATVSDDCLDPSVVEWITTVCDGLERCRVSNYSWVDMVFCDFEEEFFMQIDYTCMKQDDNVQNVVLCDTDTKEITCDAGVIKIKKANFGRIDENTCTTTPSEMTSCVSLTAEEEIKKRCADRPSCSVSNYEEDLGWPFMCDDSPLYLSVFYACQ